MTPEQRFERVLQEQRDYDAFESDMSSNPHRPFARAEQLLVADDMVPLLVDILETDRPGVQFAVFALELLGPPGRAAAAVLERRGEPAALFAVHEARARELGLHRARGPRGRDRTARSRIAELVLRSAEPERIRAHYSELLRDRDAGVVGFALDRFPATDGSRLREVLLHHVEAAPLEALRELVDGFADPLLSSMAASALSLAHLPEDAARVVRASVRQVGSRQPRERIPVEWLAGAPTSELLFDVDLSHVELFELVRRRRCAGLSNPVQRLRQRAIQAIADDPSTGAALAGELGDPWLADALVERLLDPTVCARAERSVPISAALVQLGVAAVQRLRERVASGSLERELADALRYVDASSANGLPPCDSGRADALFVEGFIDDVTDESENAFWRYAILHARGSDPHAAYQLAWIDRAFGTPITAERIAYLRALGVAARLLDELAAPPRAIASGLRLQRRRQPDAKAAARAEAAGLPGLAALLAPDDRERVRLREAASARLAHVRD